MTDEIKQLKGGRFLSRYVIKAKLTALTPFHIGDGSMREPEGMVDEKKNNKQLKCNAVVTDGNGKAYIPGSSLRGALRDWLRQGYENMTENLYSEDAKKEMAKIRDNKELKPEQKDDAIVSFIKDNSSALERIFGTQLNEGKLEVWDAYCTSKINTDTDKNGQMCFWNKDRMTYVAKSVAIDPETGTAEDGKLYNYELVPAGATFDATFSAQNLSLEEAKLLLAVLKEGFKKEDNDNPITLGAMTKLDFGRFVIAEPEIYRLDKNTLDKWRDKATKTENKCAGYDLIVDKDFALSNDALTELSTVVLPASKTIATHKETWTLNLETPLVVRSGGHFVWKNAEKKKTRNYWMEFNWMLTDKEGWHHVSDLYHSVEIKENQIVPYYHIPSSSVRGALRAWTIEHLLKREHWDIEKYLKPLTADALKNKTADLIRLEPILDLFGFAVEGTDKAITKEFTKAGRLKIIVDRFEATDEKPCVDGDWASNGIKTFGPENAKRHVKPRNPLDRITHAAKDSGLHHNLEFSEGQKFKITFKIRKAKTSEQHEEAKISEECDFDKKLLKKWREEINAGIIRIGGLTGIGRGRVSVQDQQSNTQKEAQNG